MILPWNKGQHWAFIVVSFDKGMVTVKYCCTMHKRMDQNLRQWVVDFFQAEHQERKNVKLTSGWRFIDDPHVLGYEMQVGSSDCGVIGLCIVHSLARGKPNKLIVPSSAYVDIRCRLLFSLTSVSCSLEMKMKIICPLFPTWMFQRQKI